MSHYYDRDGTPRHFEGKDGTDTTPAIGKKLGLLPSVTTLMQSVHQESIVQYRIRQALEAVATLPRLPGESVTDHLKRAKQDAQEDSLDARDQGSIVHDCLHKQKGPHWKSLKVLLAERKLQIVWQEKTLVGPDYAGTFDALLEDSSGDFGLVDFKGQEWDWKRKDILNPLPKKPSTYKDSWTMQLAAGAELLEVRPKWCANFVFHRKEPSVWYVHNWDRADIERGWHLFFHAKELWKLQNNYNIPLVVSEATAWETK